MAPIPGQPVHLVSAWDVAKMVGGRFVDLKCFSRLPGLKPGPAHIVNGVLDLALIWVDIEVYFGISQAQAISLVNPLDFDTCWHMAQEHRCHWERVFIAVRHTRTSTT